MYDLVYAASDAAPHHCRTTLWLALELTNVIPPTWPDYTVSVDDKGYFKFEWRVSEDRIIQATIDNRAFISYSGVWDGGQVIGVETFSIKMPVLLQSLMNGTIRNG